MCCPQHICIFQYPPMIKLLRLLAVALFAAATLPATALAAATEKAAFLVLTLADGSLREFELADKPTVTFNTENLVLDAANAHAEFPRGEVKSFHFSAVPLGIEKTEGAAATTLRYVDNATVQLGGLRADRVRLYDATGRLLAERETTAGRAEISLQTLPAGTYILHYDKNSSIKLIKK